MTGSLSSKRIVLAGGGTGGHITPIVVLARELVNRGAEVLWIANQNDWIQALAKDNKIPLKVIPAGKLHRYWSMKNLATPFLVLSGLGKARSILKNFKPNAVFAKGGYVSLPVVLAAANLKIPIIIHESDAVMGLANTWAAKFASRVCVNYPVYNFRAVPGYKLVETGIPINERFSKIKPLNSKKKVDGQRTILITCGSQGARSINQAIRAALPELVKKYSIIHVVGQIDYPSFKPLGNTNYQVYDLVSPDMMADFVEAADLAITRASATTLSELSAAGRPAILIPLPQGANNHQTANARLLEKTGAAKVILQNELTSGRLLGTIREILENSDQWLNMAKLAKTGAKIGATEKITNILEEIVNK